MTPFPVGSQTRLLVPVNAGVLRSICSNYTCVFFRVQAGCQGQLSARIEPFAALNVSTADFPQA
jgi:hypothetical protein